MPADPDRLGRERELRFTFDDMSLFAAASGDQSPLHMDDEFGRRTAFGERIIHGGLLTIGMLGLLPPEALADIRTVRSSYPGPVLPDERCLARAQSRAGRAGEWEIRLSSRGKLLARVATSARTDAPAGLQPDAISGSEDAIAGEYRPSSPELDELVSRFGLGRLHPALREGICWASNVVGMTIPDFDGLCAAVTLVAGWEAAAGSGPDAHAGLGGNSRPATEANARLGTGANPSAAHQAVRVREYDERTDRMLVEGILSEQTGEPRLLGLIECFPFSPTPLPDSCALTAAGGLEPERGAVVIIGASRGLGAALALACLARSYRVHGVYARSENAAAELIRLAGPHAGRLHLHRLDAADERALVQLAAQIGGPIAGLALCAAPPALPMTLDTGAELGEYVKRSLALASVPVAELAPLLERDRGWALFCSTAALDRPPREQPQLVAAKSALEGLARWLAASTPSVKVALARLPRMRTDLVNTPAARAAAAPPEAVAALLAQRLLDEELAAGVSVLIPEPQQAALV